MEGRGPLTSFCLWHAIVASTLVCVVVKKVEVGQHQHHQVGGMKPQQQETGSKITSSVGFRLFSLDMKMPLAQWDRRVSKLVKPLAL